MGWKTIDSAPKDGTRFLAYEDGNYYALEWVPETRRSGHWKSFCGQFVTLAPDPTHWRDLPPPPGSEPEIEAHRGGHMGLYSDPERERPEETAEHFIQGAVDSSPEPLRRLGEWLANKLDDDDWKTADRLLTGAAVSLAQERPGMKCTPDDLRFIQEIADVHRCFPFTHSVLTEMLAQLRSRSGSAS